MGAMKAKRIEGLREDEKGGGWEGREGEKGRREGMIIRKEDRDGNEGKEGGWEEDAGRE